MRYFKVILNSQDVGQILAALRYWQAEGKVKDEGIQNILDECGRMSAEDIDDLCEHINCNGKEV